MGKNGHQIEAEMKTLSVPEMEALLATTEGINRTLAPARVASYAEMMRNETWQMNGQGIVISKKKRLLNGQHTLAAAIRVGKPFLVLVVTGVEDDAYKTIDNIRPKSIGDTLMVDGHKNARNLASALRLYFTIETKSIYSGGKRHTIPAGWNSIEAERIVRQNKTLLEEFYESMKLRSMEPAAKSYPLSILTVARFLTKEHKPAYAKKFWEGLFGHGEDADNPTIHCLRRWLTTQISGRGGARGDEYLAVTIKAFNAFVKGRDLRLLAWRTGELFPMLGKEEAELVKA